MDTERPISRQKELDLLAYYSWPLYWSGNPMQPVSPEMLEEEKKKIQIGAYKTHLRSAREVIGYIIHSTDGEAGQVNDFIVDDSDWAIRYMSVDTGKWLPERKF